MQPLDNFLPYLIPWVGGCPTPLAHQSLVRAARTFCEETNVVTRMVEPISLVPGEATYDIDLEPDLDAIRVLGAWIGTSALALPSSRGSQFANIPQPGVTGSPVFATSTQPNTVTLYPKPDNAAYEKLSVRVATRPKLSARSLDDSLFNRWVDGVVSGAIGIIAAMPGQPFSDPAQAAQADVRFWRAVNRARIEATRGDVGSSLRVRNTPMV